MIKNSKDFEKFEKDFVSSNKLEYEKSLNLFESMWEEYHSFGTFVNSNPMEGLEADIEMVRIINNVQNW